MQKYVFTLMVVLVAFTLVLPLAAQEEGVARVRIGYIAFDPRENDTYMDGELVSFEPTWKYVNWAFKEDDLLWNTTTPYVDIPSGVHSFAFVPSGSSLDAAFLEPDVIEFKPGHTYALAVVGHPELDDLKLLTIDETEAFAGIDPAENWRGILIHDMADAPPVELEDNGETLIEALHYGEIATYSRPAGFDHTIVSTVEDQPTILFDFNDATEKFNCELMVMTGTYPGKPGSELFWTANFGNPNELTIGDDGMVTIGSTLKGEVPAITQRAAYHLSLENDSSLNISVRAVGLKTSDSVVWWLGTLDPVVYVYDSSGSLLFWNDDAVPGNVNSGLEALPLEAGEYTIEVGGYADLVGGKFQLEVERVE